MISAVCEHSFAEHSIRGPRGRRGICAHRPARRHGCQFVVNAFTVGSDKLNVEGMDGAMGDSVCAAGSEVVAWSLDSLASVSAPLG